MNALADVIRLADRAERLEDAAAGMARAFREDSRARDKDFLDRDRRIRKIEDLVEFTEGHARARQLDPPK